MANGVFTVFTRCTDPDREEEFNRWYSHTHLPDLSAAKGFTRSRRYVSVDPEQTSPNYMVLYEFESDDITASIQDLLRIAMSEFAAGRHIDCVGPVTELPSQIWQEIDPASLKPLERLEYPTQVPETIRRRVEGILQRQ